MASRRERKTSVLGRCVFERVPEADGGRRVGVEEDGVLVRWHAAADFGLLADDHGLEDARVFEGEVAGDGGVLLVDGGFGEGGVEVVQVVADFVDGAVFGLVKGAVGVEGVYQFDNMRWLFMFAREMRLLHTFFEEESHLVTTFEEVAITYMIALLAGGELGHRVVIKREVVQ